MTDHAKIAAERIQQAVFLAGHEPPPDAVLLPFIEEAIDAAIAAERRLLNRQVGPQRGPASVGQIEAQTKQARREVLGTLDDKVTRSTEPTQ